MVLQVIIPNFSKFLLKPSSFKEIPRVISCNANTFAWPFNANSGSRGTGKVHVQLQTVRFRDDDPCIKDCCPGGQCIPDCDCGKPVKKKRPPCRLYKKETIIVETYNTEEPPIHPMSKDWFKPRPPPGAPKKKLHPCVSPKKSNKCKEDEGCPPGGKKKK